MTEISIHRALREAAVDVLEKMFFIEASEESASDTGAEALSGTTSGSSRILVELTFDGDPSGVFRMSLARAATSQIAADFLGEDAESLTAHQVNDVAKELANMICGGVLSRIESRATFRLAAPAVLPEDADCDRPNTWTVCAVGTDSGALTVEIYMDTKASSPSAGSAS